MWTALYILVMSFSIQNKGGKKTLNRRYLMICWLQGLVAPSPTVNTKDAMSLVMGLFNQPIPSATKWGTANNSSASTSNPKGTGQEAAATGTPFTIFVDENPPPSCTKDQDVEDLENRCVVDRFLQTQHCRVCSGN